MISFNTIPLGILTPGVFAEIDTSRAVQGLQLNPHEVMLMGQKLTGSGTANVPYRVRSKEEAIALFGAGSQIAQMVATYKRQDPLSSVWALGVADGAGTKATGSFV